MLKVIRKTTALLVLTLLATTMATAQTVNMSKYITLTVQQGEQIRLLLRAAEEDTPVKIVSGSTDTVVTVGTGWTNGNYTAGATTMTIYGDIIGFFCGNNGTKLTAIDVSKNVALTGLWCSNNQLTALDVSKNTALKSLACSDNQLTVLDVSKNVALTGLWCSNNKLTALDVSKNTALETLECSYNQLTALDVSKNTVLAGLYCNKNQLTSLDVTQNTALTNLYCSNNQLTALNLSQNVALTKLNCNNNQLTALNLSQNVALTVLEFGDNQLTSLDVSKNTALESLECSYNQLTALDVTQNTALKYLLCNNNNFTPQAFNDLMCSLPLRVSGDKAKFHPLLSASDAGYATFMAANSQIAKDKNWQVRYRGGSADEIPATTGTYVCPTTGIEEIASAPLTVYPNPATDILTIETEAIGSAITLTDLTGRTVATATATTTKTEINITHLSAGTYIVRVGDRVGKVVKR